MMNSGVYTNPVLAEILIKGDEDFTALTPTERQQFVSFQFSRINLAVYINKLEEEGISGVHFNYVDFLIQEYQTKPGLKQFAVSISNEARHEWQDLYDELVGRKTDTN